MFFILLFVDIVTDFEKIMLELGLYYDFLQQFLPYLKMTLFEWKNNHETLCGDSCIVYINVNFFSYFSTEGKKQGSAPLNLKDEENGDPTIQYKKVQKGGDIPIKGLQKPAPEKPSSELFPLQPGTVCLLFYWFFYITLFMYLSPVNICLSHLVDWVISP